MDGRPLNNGSQGQVLLRQSLSQGGGAFTSPGHLADSMKAGNSVSQSDKENPQPSSWMRSIEL